MKSTTLNWLRAGVLGANDGIISISVLLISVVGVLAHDKLLLVGVSGLLAGSLSMAIGEYISVSAQRDAEKANRSAELTNPFHAAISSFLSFLSGAIIPLVAALTFVNPTAIVIAVIVALFFTTLISTKVGKTTLWVQLLRNMVAGGLALTLGIIVNISFGV